MDFESWVKTIFQKLWRNDLPLLVEELTARESDRSLLVFTPNLNHFRIIGSNPQLRGIYADADYLLCDGMPVSWLSKFYLNQNIARISGVDLTSTLLLASKETVVIGSSCDVVIKAYSRLGCRFDKVKVFDEFIDANNLELSVARVVKFLKTYSSRYVLLALNTDKQARLVKSIYESFPELQRTFIGVGGSFEILSGKYVRAPKSFQRAGLEWLWRAFQNPFELFPRYLFDLGFILKIQRATRKFKHD